MFATPILLITFNRPEHTRRVLTEILKQEPQDLYVCQDGPRKGNENDRIKCQEVRDVINELTTNYALNHKNFTLHTLYQPKNLGCGPGPAAGITWFFNNVEMGIVMEDDCLPHPDFFGYCEELLERYKENSQIMYISSTLYDNRWKCDASYGFSHYMVTGAWASWRRAWAGFDLDLHSFDAKAFRKQCKKILCSRAEYEWWYFKVLEIQQDKEKKSYWDYQMQIHLFNAGGLAIHPAVNLISNIGFDEQGTHTFGDDGRANKPFYPILPLQHPKEIEVDKRRDYECFTMRKYKGWWKENISYLYNTMLYNRGLLHKLLKAYKSAKILVTKW